ncbi:MAG: hypothetical protein IKB83_00010 [Mycoplasmataceae bacterium]|nr:hypothetical protein [bacterium]MBR2848879.1 hypothetical protein [Mycoplasmataceae bacterium]
MNEELEKVADKICDISQRYYKTLTKEQKNYFDSIITDIWNIIEIEDKKGDE